MSASVAGFDADHIRCFLSLDQDHLSSELGSFLSGLDVSGGQDGVFNLLQLSGGGEYGAFGAGLLNGWSSMGERPEFDMVTGISTGALSAPFAFLGEAYDRALKDSYTKVSKWDVFRLRGLTSLVVMPSSAVSSKPLQEMIASMITPEVMALIAREHQKGRRLLMATTYLDEQKFVVWDIGAIAASGNAGSLALIQNIMLASAAIPVAFPPVMINVEYDGEIFDEMHVDGSVFSSTVGIELLQGEILDQMTPKRNLYYVINWPINSVFQPVKPRITHIGFYTFAAMLKNQHRWDLFRCSFTADLAKFHFHYHTVPDYFPNKEGLPFDSEYMNQLYDNGFKLGANPQGWMDLSPLKGIE